MEKTTPGKQTSENEALKEARVWIRFACSIVAAVCTSLLATKVIPAESAWIGILGTVASIATLVAGEVVAARNYTASRTEIKLGEIKAAAQKASAALIAQAAVENAKKKTPPNESSALD